MLSVIEWDDYFMAAAILAPKISADPLSKEGACIVNQNKRIVGIGYDKPLPPNFVCHAEVNAIFNSSNVKDCTMYVTSYPCNECAKLIIQSGIKEIVYLNDNPLNYLNDYGHNFSKEMFEAAKIECRKLKPTNESITIEFSSIEVK